MNKTDEAISYVRGVLGAADPVGGTDFTDAAKDEQGRAAFRQIMDSGTPAHKPEALPAHRPKRRRRWTVVGGVALVLAGAGAAANATGLVPDGVVKGLTKVGQDDKEDGLRALTDRAKLRAETRSPKGDVVQFWEAPNVSGGLCTYLRILPKGGGKEDGGNGCGVPDNIPDQEKSAWDRVASFSSEPSVDGRTVSYGHVEPALKITSLRLTLGDGRRLSIPVKPDGYFISLLPEGVGTTPVPPEVQAGGQPAVQKWMAGRPPPFKEVAALDRTGKVVVADDLDRR